jgi:hypothetical protein
VMPQPEIGEGGGRVVLRVEADHENAGVGACPRPQPAIDLLQLLGQHGANAGAVGIEKSDEQRHALE